ncbi:hypothetical protein [Aureibacillus halotolerans]|uniref:hypothetical protein n=1 Tax=Aureibacillus halotolerans TaxID=1508390 RepID=UPI00105DEDAA|nr:hypothetical protein [Aureibacillus halotolerans]
MSTGHGEAPKKARESHQSFRLIENACLSKRKVLGGAELPSGNEHRTRRSNKESEGESPVVQAD